MLQIEEKPLEESKETEGAQKVDDSSETKAQETLAVDVNTTCAQTEKAVVSSSSGTGWTPVFVSLGDLDRPSTSALHRTSERIVGSDNLPIIGLSLF
ncbi:unnamed protein product [Anisakis simplex]|uniref:Uncharacterized protein n=1 Tax=Anisakis simplex TaxID=6269 RepID=A0A0M3JQF4_ANISI|nr:unnamed protein product [Anisakis simplex]